MKIHALSTLLLTLTLSAVSAQTAPASPVLRPVQEIRALATMGGDGKSLLSMQYDLVQRRLFLADENGYTLWTLDGMTQGADFRRAAGNYYQWAQYDFASQQAAFSERFGTSYMVGADRKASELGGIWALFNKRVYTARNDLMVYDVGSQTGRIIAPAPSAMQDMQVLSDGTRLLVRTQDRALLYSVTPGQLLKTFGPLGVLNGMQLTPDEQAVVLYNRQGAAALFDLSTGLRMADFEAQDSITSAMFSPDGTLLAFTSDDSAHSVTVWDRESGTIRSQINTSNRIATAAAFSPDGRFLAVASGETELALFNPATGERIAQLAGHTDTVRQLIFTADGRYLLSLSEDRTVRVWGSPKGAAFAQPATLTLSSEIPGATAILDRTPLGSIDATGLSLSLAADAPHLLLVTASGRLPYAATLTIKAGEERVLSVAPATLTGKATIQSHPSGANVIIDGKLAGKTPMTLENLPDGPLDYRLKYAGYTEYAGQVNVQGGGPATATAALKALPGLSVKSGPVGATVLLDGQALGVTPLVVSSLKPGKYMVTVRLKGYKDQTVTVTVPDSGVVSLDLTLKK